MRQLVQAVVHLLLPVVAFQGERVHLRRLQVLVPAVLRLVAHLLLLLEVHQLLPAGLQVRHLPLRPLLARQVLPLPAQAVRFRLRRQHLLVLPQVRQ